PRAADGIRLRVHDRPPGSRARILRQAHGSPDGVRAEEPRVLPVRPVPEAEQVHYALGACIDHPPGRAGERRASVGGQAYRSVDGMAIEVARPVDIAQAHQGDGSTAYSGIAQDQPPRPREGLYIARRETYLDHGVGSPAVKEPVLRPN